MALQKRTVNARIALIPAVERMAAGEISSNTDGEKRTNRDVEGKTHVILKVKTLAAQREDFVGLPLSIVYARNVSIPDTVSTATEHGGQIRDVDVSSLYPMDDQLSVIRKVTGRVVHSTAFVEGHVTIARAGNVRIIVRVPNITQHGEWTGTVGQISPYPTGGQLNAIRTAIARVVLIMGSVESRRITATVEHALIIRNRCFSRKENIEVQEIE